MPFGGFLFVSRCAPYSGPYSREPARMADERPFIWVQLTTEYYESNPSAILETTLMITYGILLATRWSEVYFLILITTSLEHRRLSR